VLKQLHDSLVVFR